VTEFASGAVVGRKYRLDRELTRGGMGIVWAATHLVTKRSVAIKVLRATATD
jgi:serine/threonine-protein kinase